MHSKTNTDHQGISRHAIKCVAGAAGITLIAPSYALGGPIGDAVRSVSSSPVACMGIGFSAGAAVMAIISHDMHKAEIRELRHRIELLEQGKTEQEVQAATQSEAQVATQSEAEAIEVQIDADATVAFDVKKAAEAESDVNPVVPEFLAAEAKKAKEAKSEATPQAVAPEARPVEIQAAESESAQPVMVQTQPAPAATAQRGKRHEVNPRKRLLSVEAALNERLSPNALNDVPIIERGVPNSNPETSGSLDRAHTMEVTRRLSSEVRVRVINSRVPMVGGLEPAQSKPQASSTARQVVAKAASAAPAATVAPSPKAVSAAKTTQSWDDSRQFDVNAYVENLVEEERLNRNRRTERTYSRGNLTVFEGTGDLSAARKAAQKQQTPRMQRPRGKHFAPISKEA